jgi:PQQ-dependent dehydrogenase (s-GDH family)
MFITSFIPYMIFFLVTCNTNNFALEEEKEAAPGIKVRVLVSNLDHPREIIWGPDDNIWITERKGKISRLDPKTGKVTPLFTIPDVRSRGEGGLLGMVLHPNFKSNPYVYVSYNYVSDGYKEKVVRFTYKGSDLTNPLTLIDNISASGIHNGSRLAILEDKIFITTGDASNQRDPQNTSSLNGKVLRLNVDGSIPADNPFPKNPVWSYGHRNPQGLVFARGKLYASEHGPSTDDEINIIGRGNNYGWPNVKGFCNENDEKQFV